MARSRGHPCVCVHGNTRTSTGTVIIRGTYNGTGTRTVVRTGTGNVTNCQLHMQLHGHGRWHGQSVQSMVPPSHTCGAITRTPVHTHTHRPTHGLDGYTDDTLAYANNKHTPIHMSHNNQHSRMRITDNYTDDDITHLTIQHTHDQCEHTICLVHNYILLFMNGIQVQHARASPHWGAWWLWCGLLPSLDDWQ